VPRLRTPGKQRITINLYIVLINVYLIYTFAWVFPDEPH
jgi:hypothetical protein